MRLILESVDWVNRLSSLMWLRPIQSVEDYIEQKGWPSPSKRIPPIWLPLNWDIGILAFGLELKFWLILGLKLAGPQTGTTPSSLLGLTHNILLLVSFHNHFRQFLITNLFLYVHVYIVLVLFPWKTLPNTVSLLLPAVPQLLTSLKTAAHSWTSGIIGDACMKSSF